MNIVVVGGGKVGYALCDHLSREGHDITVIENRHARVQAVSNVLDVIAVEGNGASYAVQTEAGVGMADLVIAVSGADEINMLCCMVAKKLGARHTIARVRDPEYNQQMFFLKEELGLSLVINPEQAAAAEISRILRFPSALKVEPFAKGRVELVEFRIPEGSPLDGLALKDMQRKFQTRVLICAVEREDVISIPTGDFVLRSADRISLTATPAELEVYFKAIGSFKSRVRDVMILGGGRIGYYLANQLSGLGIRVKIIEKDPARCEELCELIPKVTIICGDGSEQELLEEEGLSSADAFVALTGLDEENIILSMFAHGAGVGKVVTKVSKTGYVDMLGNSQLDCFICPKDITATRILQYVRGMQNSYGSSVETLHRIVDDKVEALEFHVRENARCTGIALKDMRLKPNMLIAGIIRGSRCIIPGGGDMIQRNDSVIVVTTDKGLCELDGILAEG